MIEYIGSAVIGFTFLFATGAAVTRWQGRHKRRDRAYWNGPA